MTLHLFYSKLFHAKMDYFGHVIKARALKIAPSTSRSVQESGLPRIVRGSRSFLGLRNVYHRFVKELLRIVASLNDLLRYGKPQRLKSLKTNAEKAFHLLIDTLATLPILELPNRSCHITAETKACDHQLGAVLLQAKADGTIKSIGALCNIDLCSGKQLRYHGT